MTLQRVNSVELVNDSDLGKSISSSSFDLVNTAAYASQMRSVSYDDGNSYGLTVQTYDNRNVVKSADSPRPRYNYGCFYMGSNSTSSVQVKPEIEWDLKLMNYESMKDITDSNWSLLPYANLDCFNLSGKFCGLSSYGDRNGDFMLILLPIKGRLTPCVRVRDSPKYGYVPLPAKVLNGDWVHFRYFYEYDDNDNVINACIEVDRKDILKQAFTSYSYIERFYLYQSVFCDNSAYLSYTSFPYTLISNVVRSSLVEV